jgi:hypothetical protein
MTQSRVPTRASGVPCGAVGTGSAVTCAPERLPAQPPLFRKLIDQSLGLLQVERIGALGELTVDRDEKIARLLPLALIAVCSSPRVAPRTLPAARGRPPANARNTLPL